MNAPVRGGLPAFLLWGMLALSCGGGADTPGTSVLLSVKNAPGLERPNEVQIDLYEGSSTQVRQSVSRLVASGTSVTLGDLVIYPAPETPRLRVLVFGRRGGQVVSSGLAEVVPQTGRQVGAVVTLMPGFLGAEGGAPAAGDGGVPDGATGGEGGGAGGNAAAPPVDAGASGRGGAGGSGISPSPEKKQAGESCGGGTDCVSGACRDNVCCDRICFGSCFTCQAPGQPVGRCAPAANGTSCRSATCGSNGRVLSQYVCDNGACDRQDTTCEQRECDARALTCQ
ncbi:MAG: hypothetical protein KA712_06615 [Myxococcales bacterium]|nr:hypothetical protein [Myxococcales bacterium]